MSQEMEVRLQAQMQALVMLMGQRVLQATEVQLKGQQARSWKGLVQDLMLSAALLKACSEKLGIDSLTGTLGLEVQLKVTKVLMLELVLLTGRMVSLESEVQLTGPQVQPLKGPMQDCLILVAMLKESLAMSTMPVIV